MGNKIGLLDWIPMIISGLAFILSLVSFIYGRKDKKDEKYYKESMQKFEGEKENIRRLERTSDIIENRLNLVSTLMTYFDIKLHDADFDTDFIEGVLRLKIGIGLINIGKDTVVNVELFPYSSLIKSLFKKNNNEENKSVVDVYFSENFAKVDDVIKLRIIKDILDADRDN